MDELPQLINILRAEMSMVGPRPERPEMFESLTAELPDYEKRLAVKPGLTGLAQINVGYDVDVNTVRRKLEMDLEYIETMSLGMDVKVIAATVGKFNDRSAR
jgi:lipopolysaccharide/colanic/teichoic acid biosynthesis glycosyltransferase